MPAPGGVPTSLHAGALASLSAPGGYGNPAATGMKLAQGGGDDADDARAEAQPQRRSFITSIRY